MNSINWWTWFERFNYIEISCNHFYHTCNYRGNYVWRLYFGGISWRWKMTFKSLFCQMKYWTLNLIKLVFSIPLSLLQTVIVQSSKLVVLKFLLIIFVLWFTCNMIKVWCYSLKEVWALPKLEICKYETLSRIISVSSFSISVDNISFLLLS